MIAATGLTKRYGPLVAVDNIDLAVHRGDIYGFLGANGSGKTTTLRMLLGLVLPTSGSIQLLNESMPKASHRVLPRVGALVEGPSAYGHLSAFTHLSFLDAMGPGGSRGNRRQRIVEVLGQVGLAGVGNRPIKAYSLGMHQRLGLAAALLRHPELLILDEPTNGLDPQGIHEIRDLLLTLNRAGTTVFSRVIYWPRSSSCAPVSAYSTGAVSFSRRRCTSCVRRPGGPSCTLQMSNKPAPCWPSVRKGMIKGP